VTDKKGKAMNKKWQDGYKAGIEPDDVNAPQPGQTIQTFLHLREAELHQATDVSYWIDSCSPELAEYHANWYRGYIAGIKAQWAARLKTEELYPR
jgi:hypothetical protein